MIRRRRPAPRQPWEHDPRNPDMLVLRTWMEPAGFGEYRKVTRWVTALESQQLSQEGVQGETDWRNDPTYHLAKRRRRR